MDFQTTWNEIVELYNDNLNVAENIIQHDWEKRILPKKLGYVQNEIDSQFSIKMGSTNKKLDILLKKDNRKICVVELKQHVFNKDDGGKEQLFSYLRQLYNVPLGILVCDRLYVFHFSSDKTDDDQACIEIPFKENNEDGAKFTELFYSSNYNQHKIIAWIEEKYKVQLAKIKKQLENENLIKTIRSEITDDLKKELLRNYFIDKYHCERSVVDKAFENIQEKIRTSGTKISFKGDSYSRKREKFREWLIQKRYSSNTANSYLNGLNKIYQHQMSIRGVNIWEATKQDILQLVREYADGKYKKIGQEGHNTVINSLRRYSEFL